MSSSIPEIEKQIKDQKKIVEFGESIVRLQGNRDFRKVILDGYFKDEAIRLVLLKAAPDMQTAERQSSIVSAMDAIGNLHQFLNDAVRCSEIAAKEVASGEATVEEMLAEEAAQ